MCVGNLQIFTFELTAYNPKWYCNVTERFWIESKSSVAKETVNCYTKERERNTN
jgi:hypothetical protein